MPPPNSGVADGVLPGHAASAGAPPAAASAPSPQPAVAPASASASAPAPAPTPAPNPFLADAHEEAQAQKVPAVNPFLADARELAVSQRAMVEAAVTAGQEKDPERHAKSVELADRLGLPPSLVEPQFERYSKAIQKAEADYPALVRNNPRLAAWLGNVDNAAVAQDDIPVLRSIDDAVRDLTHPGDPYGILPEGFRFAPNGSIVEHDGTKAVATYPNLEALNAELNKRQEAYEAQDREAKIGEDILRKDFGPLAPLASGAIESAGSLLSAGQHVASWLGASRQLDTNAEAQRILSLGSHRIAPGFGGDLQRGAGGIIADLPLMLSGGIPARAARALLAGRAGLGLLPTVAKSKYLSGAFEAFAANLPLATKGGIGAGADHGLAYGIVDTAINSISPFGRTGIARAVTGGARAGDAVYAGWLGAARHILTESGMEASEEATQELAQALHEANTGVDPDALQSDRLLRRMAVAGALGGLAGAAFNVPEAAGIVVQQRHLAAQAALSFADSTARILEHLEQSKTQERTPERVQQYLASAVANTPAAHVLYQGSEFDEAAAAAGVDPAVLAGRLGIANARMDALGTGADMQVPTAALIAEMAKIKADGGDPKALLMALRQAPMAPSAQEAQTFYQDGAKEIEAQAKAMQAEVHAQARKTTEEDPIFQDVLRQAIEAGTSKAVATQQAKIFSAIFRVQASRWNAGIAESAPRMDPVAEYERYQLKIMRGLPTETTPLPNPNADAARALAAKVRKGATPKDPRLAHEIDAMRAEMQAHGIDPMQPGAADALLAAQAQSAQGAVENATDDLLFQPGPATGETFDQPKRGRIDIKRFIISLLEASDQTTLLHEGAHFYLEVLGDFAERDGAPPEIVAQYAAILKWLGVSKRSEIGREQHEKFAGGFEKYLEEGKAPSEELRGAFRRFKAWFAAIYKSIRNTITLTPEIRDVFDRMLATDEELQAARGEPEAQSHSLEWTEGMTAAEKARYLDHVARDNNGADAAFTAKMMAPVVREQTKAWKEAFAARRPKEEEAVNAMPVFVAFNLLTRGAHKLDRADVVRVLGKDGAAGLPKAVFSKTGEAGLTLQQAAEATGFKTGEDLWKALANMPKRERLIDDNTRAYLREQHQDPLLDGTAAEEALKALHRSAHADVLNAQSLALAVRANRRALPLARIRSMAENIVKRQPVPNVNPMLYLRAERRYGKLAFEKLRLKDYTSAFQAKQQELLNHELFRIASDAKETIAKADKLFVHVLTTPVQMMLGKAGGYVYKVGERTFADYDDAVIAAEETGTQIEETGGHREVATRLAMEAREKRAGMTFAQYDYSRWLVEAEVHMAQAATKLNRIAAGEELKAAEERLGKTADAYGRVLEKPLSPGWWDRLKARARSANAYLTNLSTMTQRMDGFHENGPFWNLLMRPWNDAGAQEIERQYQTADRFRALFQAWGKTDVYAAKREAAIGDDISLMGKIMVALNYGTAHNRERVTTGFKWTAEQVTALLDTLDQADWTLVNAISVEINSFFPELNEQHRRLFGVPIEKEEALPIETKYGLQPGGYFPIVYDSAYSPRVSDQQLSTDAKASAPVQPATNRGMTKPRVATTGQRLLLDENVIFRHIADVVHRITHEDALSDVRKLLNSKAVRQSIVDRYGIDAYRTIKDTIVDIAKGEAKAQGTFEKAARYMRTGMSIATMGYSATTAAVQLTGVTQSIQRTGAEYFGRAVREILQDAASLESTNAWVTEKSTQMRNRTKTFHRDVMASVNRLGPSTVLDPVRNYAYYAMQKTQYMVDLPTWVAAYRKHLYTHLVDPLDATAMARREADAVAVADQTVLDTQGGGQTKDLAKIQRGNEYLRMFTAFYNYFSITYQRGADSIAKGHGVQDVPRLATDFLLLVSMPVVFSHILMAALKGDDDKDTTKRHLAKRLAQEHLSFLLNTVVFARELSGGVQGFDYSGPGGGRAFKALTDLYQQTAQGKADKGLWHAAASTAGILLHLPSTQIVRTIDGYLYQQEHRTGPLPILFGPPAHTSKR